MKQKNIFFRSVLAFLLVLATVLACGCAKQTQQTPPSGATTETPAQTPADTVTVLYTNDIHAYLNNDAGEDGGLSYAALAQMKADLGENVLLVDAGDHVQGSVYGAMDQGQSVLEIMDEIYDVATLGNHEFDYGVARTLSLTANAKYPYISCNFVHKESGKTVLEPHVMKTVGNVKVGFVGITTPETMTGSAPSYFQNEKGEYIYDFLDNEALYAAVQASIDALRADGADYVIALGHVGVDQSSAMTSHKIIANITGLDAFIDGHSHTAIEQEKVKDKAGCDVLLTQTGYYFGAVGKMTLGPDGVKTSLVHSYSMQDPDIHAMKEQWVTAVGEMLGQKIGVLGSPLSVNDENGNRIVRVMGSAIGEFVADSYYYYVNFVSELDCDVAIINGGGLRADIAAGEVSYMSLKATNPFGNMLCVVELSGQQILDMLEWGSRSTTGVAGQSEEGAFLHTAGLQYTVDTTVSSTVQQNDQGIWVGGPRGAYRVKDVKIYDKEENAYVALDLQKTYCVAGANYTLISGGDGFGMVNGRVLSDYIVEDYMALAVYAISFADTNGDDLSDITSQNSPLCVYTGYTVQYEALHGANRVQVNG